MFAPFLRVLLASTVVVGFVAACSRGPTIESFSTKWKETIAKYLAVTDSLEPSAAEGSSDKHQALLEFAEDGLRRADQLDAVGRDFAALEVPAGRPQLVELKGLMAEHVTLLAGIMRSTSEGIKAGKLDDIDPEVTSKLKAGVKRMDEIGRSLPSDCDSIRATLSGMTEAADLY